MARKDQQQVDYEFDILTQKPMTMEGTASKVIALFLVLLAGAGVTWLLEFYSLLFPDMCIGLVLGLLAYALVQGVFIGGISGLLESF